MYLAEFETPTSYFIPTSFSRLNRGINLRFTKWTPELLMLKQSLMFCLGNWLFKLTPAYRHVLEQTESSSACITQGHMTWCLQPHGDDTPDVWEVVLKQCPHRPRLKNFPHKTPNEAHKQTETSRHRGEGPTIQYLFHRETMKLWWGCWW